MVFSSLTFLCIFLPITFLMYYLIPSIAWKNAWLIIASLVFYAYGEPIYVFLMIGSTIANYVFGRLLENNKSKLILVISILWNLAMIGIFKYADMAVHTLNQIANLQIPEPGIKLPIGISFFTFQIMSYVIDVYRGQTEAQKSYWKLLLYIMLFPQLIAGPIIKYHDIAEQISSREISIEKAAKGVRRFIIGLSKKVLISNTVALTADQIFALESSEMGVAVAWIGAICYVLQIYFDFSGYSDMAIGLGYMFGFDFMENFQYPYISTTVKEFWRRWHISLSTWFKEYLYIPLGGNRKGIVRTCVNKMIVFFCTGLWHGANWTFVIWGLFHGLFLLLEEFLPIKKLPKVLGHIYTLIVVICGFVIFRADNITQGIIYLGSMFGLGEQSGQLICSALQYCTPLLIFTVLVGVVGSIPWKRYVESYIASRCDRFQSCAETATYMVSALLLVLCILNLSGGTYNPFIYFRF